MFPATTKGPKNGATLPKPADNPMSAGFRDLKNPHGTFSGLCSRYSSQPIPPPTKRP